ncbi:hypothetical protein [Anatilimnocola floriformis]|uniref:hypothetical protein n=1 Tax=Anatilimnocola floriformis TaxID=2948575 RepID=UPI0020C43980|nr:hypothetical protein [Anatilimnocola floriformis]
MHALWILLALCSAQPEIGEGSLLFLENCNSVVEYATRDEIGHVAIAFRDGNETWIYEATPGNVRRVTFAEYDQELARINAGRNRREPVRLWIVAPEQKFTAAETTAMREYLDEQLGRRYSVKNYVLGKPGDGTHCAELAANTLNRSGRFELADSHTIHPAKLMKIVEPVYSVKTEHQIAPLAASEPWYVRWGRCCSSTGNWCTWSCREAWSFCW